MRWILAFSALALGGLALVLFVLWAVSGYKGLGLDTVGTIAVIVGVTLTSALGTGLMALLFYSDRSNIDEEVYHAAQPSPEQDGENSARGHSR